MGRGHTLGTGGTCSLANPECSCSSKAPRTVQGKPQSMGVSGAQLCFGCARELNIPCRGSGRTTLRHPCTFCHGQVHLVFDRDGQNGLVQIGGRSGVSSREDSDLYVVKIGRGMSVETSRAGSADQDTLPCDEIVRRYFSFSIGLDATKNLAYLFN